MGEPAVLGPDGVPFAGCEREPRQLFDLPGELLALRVAR